MARAVTEFQSLLGQLAQELQSRIELLLASALKLEQSDLLAFMTDAAPELITPFLTAAAELTALWYDDQNPQSDFVATPVDVITADDLASSARWAMLQDNPAAALAGAASNALFQTSRETVATNADREGVRWARFAKPDACGFCKLLAVRGYVYKSEDSAQAVSHKDATGHTHCQCTAYPERGGPALDAGFLAKYEVLLKQWKADYDTAVKMAGKNAGSIANAMDYLPGGRRYKGVGSEPHVVKPRAPKTDPAKGKPKAAPKADTAPAPAESDAQVAKRLLPGFEESLKNLRAQGLPENSPQIQYHLAQIARLKRQLQTAR